MEEQDKVIRLSDSFIRAFAQGCIDNAKRSDGLNKLQVFITRSEFDKTALRELAINMNKGEHLWMLGVTAIYGREATSPGERGLYGVLWSMPGFIEQTSRMPTEEDIGKWRFEYEKLMEMTIAPPDFENRRRITTRSDVRLVPISK